MYLYIFTCIFVYIIYTVQGLPVVSSTPESEGKQHLI